MTQRVLAIRHLLARLRSDRRGATAVEYGLIIAVIVLAMLIAFVNVAGSTIRMWGKVSNEVESAR